MRRPAGVVGQGRHRRVPAARHRPGLEIHGAAGDREERDLRLWVGRAKADDLLFGSAADHRRIVADQLLSTRRARTSQLASALLG